MADDNTDRVQGVDFTAVDPLLEELSYPITADELVARYGDREVGRTNADPISLRELFSGIDDTFESDEDVRQMILDVMPEESVGREDYSDRGGALPEETPEADARNEDESL